MALPPFTVRAAARPAKPATGGHYVPIGGGRFQQIHATGPGKWAPGPPQAKQKAAPARPAAKPTSAANPFSSPLYDPTQTLTGKPLYQAVQAQTNLQYDPTISQLTQQIGQNERQGAAAQQATAGYFNQLGQYASQSADRVAATGQGLNATLQGIGQGTQSALDQFGQRAAAPALGQLADQGLGGGAPQQLAAALASQKLLAGQNAASDQSYGAKIGANAGTLADQSLGTYALRGQERLGNIAAATRLAQQPVETKLASTRALKSAAFGTNLMAARAAERNYGVAQAGLGIKAQGIASTAATAAANRTAANQRTAATITGQNQRNTANIDARAVQGNLDRQSRQSIANQNNATRKAVASGKSSAAGGKPAPPAAQRTIWNGITAIQGRVRWLSNWIQQQTKTDPATAATQAWHGLQSGRLWAPPAAGAKAGSPTSTWHWVNIPPVGDTGLLNVAYNSVRPNSSGLTAGDVSYLHAMGFTIGNRMPIAPAKTLPNALGAIGPALSNLF